MVEDKPRYPVVTLETTIGTIKLELWPDKAPVTVENFLTYVREGFYDGLIFHRAVHNFVVQTGGYEPGMVYREPTHPPIKNEADNGLQNKRGTLAMARAYPINSAAAQFFINLVDNPKLDHKGPEPVNFGYAVFGRVLSGLHHLEILATKPVTIKEKHQNVPVEEVVILKATVDEA